MRTQQAGFTLLEVMVAVFVLAIGLLGMAHLQVTTLKANTTAGIKTQANILAGSILERMKANTTAAYAKNYDILFNQGTPAGNSVSDTDLREWRAALAAYLPAGQGQVVCGNYLVNQPFICTITVSWSDIQLGDANTNYGDYATSTMVLVSAI
ncbi:type IV pilus modification protein PilV [Methylophaga thalassica]|jgi:type IV pilus assembly protein PilV|uniref:type IV pilus modification protein PilV n=1 Tax=Methylophaga thalassica TaxID=40223 RepID=UPI002E7B31EF|nr:type IV pilus modification protein PilV [Methylophaga thalassica]WVI85864.1 type IV pilus modification protein PilV [Methylophaga thalassica]